jgi:putative Mn2+ efflux pump MntP
MGLLELFMIAIGLSMDAFAVALCKGLCMEKLNFRHSVIIGIFFGGFQAGMPLIGWLLGHRFEKYITAFDHWIAFILLSFIGGSMIIEALKADNKIVECNNNQLHIKELFLLATATSIDALAVGITFAFLGVSILPSITIIGTTTFVLSAIGVVMGNKFGVKYKRKAEVAGGVVLILIGVKILFEHLNIFTI